MSDSLFPAEAIRLAAHYSISPALAFGLGEGLNLYYRRQMETLPPHQLQIVPAVFAETLRRRVHTPRPEAIRDALVRNAHGAMVCTGDPHGVDAIEKWGEELPFWQQSDGWETSIAAAAELIEQSDGLYRRAYARFLDEARPYHDGLDAPRALIEEISDDWLDIAARLRRGDTPERLGGRVLRMAGRESRFWGQILDRFQSPF